MKNCSKVIVIRNSENKGVAHAWNQGMKVALTKGGDSLLIITNNDIVFDKDCIDVLVSGLRNSNSFVSAMHEEKEGFGDEQIFWSCFGIHRELFNKTGYFDEFFFPARGEDLMYGLRLDIVGAPRIRMYGAKVQHEHNGTAKNLDESSEWKHHDWAGTLGRNLQYYENKKKEWGY